jgi:hypothetical protein
MSKSKVGQFVKATVLGMTVASVLAMHEVNAAMDTPMQKIFGEMTTTTDPGVYKDALGTTLYLGSMKTRTPIVSLQPIMSLQEPSVRGGCGGFDVTAGSIGFISGEDLANFVKGIASNAQNLMIYAFMMTIKSQCTVCGNVLTWLHDIQNVVNQSNLNSCTAAERILTGQAWSDVKNWGEGLKNAVMGLKMNGGGVDDVKAAQKGLAGYLGSTLGSDTNKRLGGNIVFSAMRDQRAASWFGITEDTEEAQEFYESVLSLTGGVYVGYRDANKKACVPTDSDSDTQACKMELTPITVTLGLRDFYEGATGKSVHKCEYPLHPSDPCSNMSLGTAEIKPFKKRFDDLFLGPDGILAILSTPQRQLSDAQKQAIGMLSSYTQAMSLMRSLATNPSALEGFYHRASGFISVEMTYSFVKAMLESAISSLETTDKVAAKDTIKRLYARKAELAREYAEILKEQQVSKDDIELHELYRKLAKDGA